MIDFTLTEEQQSLQKLVRDFAQNELAPIAAELDEEQRHSPEIVEGYYKLGLLHYAVPEQYGGAGLATLDGVIFAEELGAADSGIPTRSLCRLDTLGPKPRSAVPPGSVLGPRRRPTTGAAGIRWQ